MLLIAGLGNPGPKYEFTRHNIGFMAVDKVVKNMVPATETWQKDAQSKSELFKKGDLVFVKPHTFMNASGVTIKKLADFYKIEVGQIWIIHDDIDLPLGKIRIRIGGGSAGHHGIESVMRETGSDTFVRFRLGVGKGKLDANKNSSQNNRRQAVEKYVVSAFTTHEEGEVRKLIKHAAKAIELALHKGIDKAMNQYN